MASPTHDPKTGQLTRHGMIQSVRDGKSFIFNGNIIASLDDPNFPSPADIAKATGSGDELEELRRKNSAEIERLKAENEELRKGAAAKQAPAAVPATAPHPAIVPAK